MAPSCLNCGSIAVVLLSKRKVYLCEDCDHQWAAPSSTPDCFTTLTASTFAPMADSALPELVLNHFPFPIAWGYRNMADSQSATWAVDCAFYTYTSLLRLTTLIFLAQFLRSTRQNPQAVKAIQHLQTPSLESWFYAMNTLRKHLFSKQQDKQGLFPSFAEDGPFSADLVLAAQTFSKLKHNGLQIHGRLRDLRNERSHEPPWDEAECGKRLPEIRQLLEIALGIFSPLAAITLRRKSPGGLIRLTGGQEMFTESIIDDIRLETLFEDSATILQNSADELLPLYPLFLPPDETLASGYTEPLLVFSGHGQKSALYLGVKSRSERQDTLGHYLDLLRSKNIDPGFTIREFTPWSVSQWARETSLGVVENLKGVKYFPDFYQKRLHTSQRPSTDEEIVEQSHGVDDAVRRWLDQGWEAALIVTADAGAGKTSLYCRIAEQLLEPQALTLDFPVQGWDEKGDCVLLLLGGSLRDGTRLFDRIRDGLGFTSDPAHTFNRFDELLTAWLERSGQADPEHEQRRIIILLDAVNEAQDAKKLVQEVSELAAMAAVCNKRLGRAIVRLLVSIRSERIHTLIDRWDATGSSGHFLEHPHNFAHFPDIQGREQPYLSLRPFTEAEAAQAYQAAFLTLPASCPAQWEQLTPATRELLAHPLMVLLFHQAFAGKPTPPALAATGKIWDAWLERSFAASQGGPNSLESRALALADVCIEKGYDQIPPPLAADWRRAWQERLDNDPVRIAAGLDDLERLSEAGFLRVTESGGLDWVSDSLAEQVFLRALRRRDPNLSYENLEHWMKLPKTARLTGVLYQIGMAKFTKNPRGLLYSHGNVGNVQLLTEILALAAPSDDNPVIQEKLEEYKQRLKKLIEPILQEGDIYVLEDFKKTLQIDVNNQMKKRIRISKSWKLILSNIIEIAEVQLSNNMGSNDYKNIIANDLKKLYFEIGEIEENLNMNKAFYYYCKGLTLEESLNNVKFKINFDHCDKKGTIISELLIEIKKSNFEYILDLKIVNNNLYNLALFFEQMALENRDNHKKSIRWSGKVLAICKYLLIHDKKNIIPIGDLLSSMAHNMMEIDEPQDPDRHKIWFKKWLALEMLEEDPEEVKRLFGQDLTIYKIMQEIEIENPTLLHGFICTKLNNEENQYDPEKAYAWCTRVLEKYERLAAMEPDNTEYLSDCCVVCQTLAKLKEHHSEAALPWWQRGAGYSAHLAELQPTEENSRNLTYWLMEVAKREQKSNPDDAWKNYERILCIRQELVEETPQDAMTWSLAASALGAMAQFHLEQGNTAREREYSLRAHEAMERGESLNPDDAGIQYGLACTRARLEKTNEALVAFSRSVELGNTDADHAEQDCDLRFLRDLPAFQAILARMREKK